MRHVRAGRRRKSLIAAAAVGVIAPSAAALLATTSAGATGHTGAPAAHPAPRAVTRIAAPVAAPATGKLSIVQAVPGSVVNVLVDGKPVSGAASSNDVKLGTVLGPVAVPVGRHTISFQDTQSLTTTQATVRVKPTGEQDVVLHRGAAVASTPVVSVYGVNVKPTAAGLARVLLAHTATAGAADVLVDGQAAFTDVTNGEFAQADIPAGSHTVTLLAHGRSFRFHKPWTIALAPGTVTAAYAVGNPFDHSMTVVAHVLDVGSLDQNSPNGIHTGSAGLASRIVVHTFRVPTHS